MGAKNMSEKLCVDCAMHRFGTLTYHQCGHPDASKRDVVDGICSARVERAYGRCGPDGALFLQRFSWWDWLTLLFPRGERGT